MNPRYINKDKCGYLTIPSFIDNKPVTGIYNKAFKDYANLINVVIPNSITSINDDAFNGCYNLDLIIPITVGKIGCNALKGIKSVKFEQYPWNVQND